MADQAPTPPQLLGPQERAVTVAIKTPGVEHPTTLPDIRLRTTIGDLKKLITDRSPLHPAESRQRLIFHGRPLLRDEQTLLEALGENMIRDMDTITIHMALRDPPDNHPPPTGRNTIPVSSTGAISVPLQPAEAGQSSQHGHQNVHQPRVGRQPHPGPTNPFSPMNVTAAMAQQQRQFMAQWANNLHREGLNRHALAAHNHMRAAANSNSPQAGPQSSGTPPSRGTVPPVYNPLVPGGENVRGRSSPAPNLQPGMTRTVVREGVSPSGTRWRLVNQHPAGTDPGHRSPGAGGLSAQEVQNILRNADAGHASQTVASAMQRSASSASLPSGLSPHVSVTTPLVPGSRPLSRTATPDPTRTPSYGSSVPMPGNIPAGQSQPMPEVYLLQSPQGPRALLFNGNAGAYFTPIVPPAPSSPPAPAHPWTQANPAAPPQPPPAAPVAPTPTVATGRDVRRRRGQQGRARVEVVRRQNAGPMHPRNPGGAAFVARMWPHVWLLLRLALFIWWFTSPDTSWYRWLMLVSLAFAIFILNTGAVNGFADQAWGPIRRHFENMIPLNADHEAPGQARAADGQEAAPGRQAGDQNNPARAEPRPEDMAARLVEQQGEANHNWLQGQIRRVERAGLLFLASLAPGIAERHIRHIEQEQQRMERERREAEAAAAAQADANQNAENQGGGQDEGHQEEHTGGEAGLEVPTAGEASHDTQEPRPAAPAPAAA